MKKGALKVDLAIPADWARIDVVREAVARSLLAVYTGKEVTDALPMVAAELLENAVKYGKSDPAGIGFLLRDDGDRVIIEVTNAIDPASPDLAILRSRIRWVEGFAEPSKAYLAALEEVYNQAPGGPQPGLGIVRVAYEGGCRLECDTTRSGWVTVRATYSLVGRVTGEAA